MNIKKLMRGKTVNNYKKENIKRQLFSNICILGFCIGIILNSSSCKSKDGLTWKEAKEIRKKEKVFYERLAKFNEEQYSKMPFFPAEINHSDNYYTVQINSDVNTFYGKEFSKHKLYANGYCWESIILQLLKEKKSDILPVLVFDAEADICFIRCDNKNTMIELAEFIHFEFSDKRKFSKVLKEIDKKKLDC